MDLHRPTGRQGIQVLGAYPVNAVALCPAIRATLSPIFRSMRCDIGPWRFLVLETTRKSATCVAGGSESRDQDELDKPKTQTFSILGSEGERDTRFGLP